MRTKLASLLAAAARGIGANPTAGAADLLVFVHGVLDAGLAAEEAAAEAAKAAAETAGQANGVRSIPLPSTLQIPVAQLMRVMACTTLFCAVLSVKACNSCCSCCRQGGGRGPE